VSCLAFTLLPRPLFLSCFPTFPTHSSAISLTHSYHHTTSTPCHYGREEFTVKIMNSIHILFKHILHC
jgi:hypothetical protein